jgi:hypothetical protein
VISFTAAVSARMPSAASRSWQISSSMGIVVVLLRGMGG